MSIPFAALTPKQTEDLARLSPSAETAEGEQDLRAWAYESHKDFYGTKGRWAMSCPITEVVVWLVQHFTWTPAAQSRIGEDLWEPTKPFGD